MNQEPKRPDRQAEECQQRKEHGQATEPRFEIKLPKQDPGDMFGTLLGE